jgi:Putative peptidoglycan binding domain
MTTAYTTGPEAKESKGLLIAAVSIGAAAIVAIVAVIGFALGGHFKSATAAPAPAPAHIHTIVTPVTPAVPVTPVTPTPTPTPAPAPVSPAVPVTPITPAPSAAVKTLQSQLAQLNYYEGSIDGLMGPQTTAAITYLQRDAGLPQTGVMNAATQAALANFLANGNNQMGGNVNMAS